MNDRAIASDSSQWELGRLEHGLIRPTEHGWSVEHRTEAIWYSNAALRYQLDDPDERGYRTQLPRYFDFSDGLPCFAYWGASDREKGCGPENCIAEFPTHYLSDLECYQLADPEFLLPTLDHSKPIVGFPPQNGYAFHGVYTRRPLDDDWIGTTFGFSDEPIPKELVQDARDPVFGSFLRQRSAEIGKARAQFLSNPFQFNRLIKPMEAIFRDGRVASLIPAPRDCRFSGLLPTPTADQSFELKEGLVEDFDWTRSVSGAA